MKLQEFKTLESLNRYLAEMQEQDALIVKYVKPVVVNNEPRFFALEGERQEFNNYRNFKVNYK